MKTTIGGDRLGSGQKESVSMRNYDRSTHDLSYTWRSSMAAGTLVPFMVEQALPGDSFDINLNCEVLTLPTVGPLFGSFKVQLDVFQVPIRLYQGRLHMNELGIGMKMDEIKLPQIRLKTPWNTSETSYNDLVNVEQINPSALLRYLGISGLGSNGSAYDADIVRDFNAVPFLAYYSIFKEYYSNKQEDTAYAIGVGQNNRLSDVKWANAYVVAGFGYPLNIYDTEVVFTDDSAIKEVRIGFGVGETQADPVNCNILVDDISQPLTDVFDEVSWVQDPLVGGYFSCTGLTNPGTVKLEVPPQDVPPIGGVPDFSKIALRDFPLKNIDDMRKNILRWDNDSTAYILNVDSTGLPYSLSNSEVQNPNGRNPRSTEYSQNGLCVKTYQSDIFNNWISTEWIDGPNGVNEVTKVDTTGDSFTIDALNLAKKVYVMLNRIAISGGTYDDWLDAVYTHERRKGTENPVYMGSLIKELSFQEVISNSEAESTDGILQPLGTLAGRGRLTSKNKGGQIKVKVDEPSYIMGIVSITPRIDYSQGNRFYTNLRTLDDLHKPALDAIGFQDLVTDQMHYKDTLVSGEDDAQDPFFRSAGKQPAWIDYMTNYNRCYGNFADRQKDMFMTLNRRYEIDQEVSPVGPRITDLTTYIDPAKYNFIFAQTDLSAQNFWVQIANNITARRKMSAKVIPNL